MGATYSGGKYDFATAVEREGEGEGRKVLDNELLGLPMEEDLEGTVERIVRGELKKEVRPGPMMITEDHLPLLSAA